MKVKKTLHSEFVAFFKDGVKSNGFDELSSTLVSLLFISPQAMALEDLAKNSSYSLSAVSTSMKFMEQIGIVTRMKKPKSRKVFYYMEKDMMRMMMQKMQVKYDNVILRSIDFLPKLIDKYKTDKAHTEELKIIEKYYKQIYALEKIFKQMLESVEKIAKKGDN